MNSIKKTSTKKSAGEDTPRPDFETTLNELEELVEKMEAGELSLEASLEAFERGVKLTRACQVTLKQAELRIQVLTEDNQDIVPPEEGTEEGIEKGTEDATKESTEE